MIANPQTMNAGPDLDGVGSPGGHEAAHQLGAQAEPPERHPRDQEEDGDGSRTRERPAVRAGGWDGGCNDLHVVIVGRARVGGQ